MKPADPQPGFPPIAHLALPAVLDSLLGVTTTAASPPTDPLVDPDPPFAGAISLTGPSLEGRVRLTLDRAFAEAALARLTGTLPPPRADDPEVADFVGELGNMVAGRIASLLGSRGHPCSLGTPQISRLPGHPTGPGPGPDPGPLQSRTHWACDGHLLTMEIHGRFHTP